MQVIILAGGRGSRMQELTLEKPKPLLDYQGQSLIKYKLQNLPKKTSEILIVTGYMGNLIREHLGSSFQNIPIKYIEQKELLGTGDAVFKCKEHIKNDFLVLMGDDIYNQQDLEKICQDENWEILLYQSDDTAGNCIIENNQLVTIEEIVKYENPMWTGAAYLDKRLFNKNLVEISNGEFGLPQTFSQFINEIPIKISETKNWIRITSPDDLK